VASFHIVALVVKLVRRYKTLHFYIGSNLRAIVNTWHSDFIRQLAMLPMQQLEKLFSLSEFADWPNADGLNLLKTHLSQDNQPIPQFVCQSQLEESEQYYEQIIFQQQIIPTRPNSWHDLFNALVWLQFPKTKGLLNQLHVEDIQQFGLSPRTSRRNNLTHFDECGVILTYQKGNLAEQLIDDLAAHHWHKVFVENRHCWGKQLNSFIFGHANLEMLLQPFIGLTGKWLAVQVDEGFSELSYPAQLTKLDGLLVDDIRNKEIFSQKRPLKPIPLLGIPDMWNANTNPAFYANTDYFRPKPKVG
jgi:hypothetical protein